MMFWAGRDDLAEIKSLGISCGQLGIGGDIALTREFAAVWKNALGQEHFSVVTVVCAFEGERYSDIPTVQRTVGFMPQRTRAARERRTMQVIDFAAELGVPSIGCHIGFVPDDRTNEDYVAVRDVVRRICDCAAAHHQTFALETGQESAQALLRFIEDTGRGNLKINFDPANMILYGTGNPMEAFDAVAEHVISVHAKDADWPAAAPGALGVERRLGDGAVGMERFVAALKRHGYRGTVNIEREIEDQAQRMADVAHGARLLRELLKPN